MIRGKKFYNGRKNVKSTAKFNPIKANAILDWIYFFIFIIFSQVK